MSTLLDYGFSEDWRMRYFGVGKLMQPSVFTLLFPPKPFFGCVDRTFKLIAGGKDIPCPPWMSCHPHRFTESKRPYLGTVCINCSLYFPKGSRAFRPKDGEFLCEAIPD